MDVSVNLKIETNVLSSGDIEVFEYGFIKGRIRLTGSKTFSSTQNALDYIRVRMQDGTPQKQTTEPTT